MCEIMERITIRLRFYSVHERIRYWDGGTPSLYPGEWRMVI